MNDWPPSRAEIAAFFNRRAGTYNQSEIHRWLAERTVDILQLPPNGIFLDLAAGTGLALSELASRVSVSQSRFLAIDIAADLLAVARWSAQEVFPVEILLDDVQQLPLASSSVDVAVCVAAFAYLPEPLKAYREWRRVLRLGGQLGFQVFAADTMVAPRVFRDVAATMGLKFTDPNGAMGNPRLFGDALHSAGFAVDEVRPASWRCPIPTPEAFWNVMIHGVLVSPMGALPADVRDAFRDRFIHQLEEEKTRRDGHEEQVSYFVRAIAV